MCRLAENFAITMKPTKVLLSWNDNLDIKVDRYIVGESCGYLKALLLGEFKERNEERVVIYIDVPFIVFESALIYAEHKDLKRFAEIPFYIDLLELASMWCFDTLREEIEIILIHSINMQTICDIHTVANVWKLSTLQYQCEYYESLVERNAQPLYRYWPIGPKPEDTDESHESEPVVRTTIRRVICESDSSTSD